MTFEEYRLEEPEFLEFEILKCQMALHKQTPTEIIRIDNKKSSKFIVLKVSDQGVTTTKTINLPRESAVFFASFFSVDFPDCPCEYHNNRNKTA